MRHFLTAKRFATSASAQKVSADVVIAGGGVMGSSCAYFIKKAMPQKKVVVIERDPAYKIASTVLSVGGFRQQFSVKENVEISLFSNRFLNNLPAELACPANQNIDLQYFQEGYLVLASNDAGAETLRENYQMQMSLGLSPEDILLEEPDAAKKRFPWLNTDDLTLTSVGLRNEGWLDPWALLNAFRKKAASVGVTYLRNEVDTMTINNSMKVEEVLCKDGTRVEVGEHFINSTGCWSGALNEKLRELLPDKTVQLTNLPVVPKRRNVWVLNITDRDAQWLESLEYSNMPLVFDSAGWWFRRDGRKGSRTFLVGKSPSRDLDMTYDTDISIEESARALENYDEDVFLEEVWPEVAHRAPFLAESKLVSGWSGFYDYNLLDQNAVVGWHTEVKNMLVTTGFSGHGLQQSPAVGRAIAELVEFGAFKTIDLSRLGMTRIKENKPLREKNIY